MYKIIYKPTREDITKRKFLLYPTFDYRKPYIDYQKVVEEVDGKVTKIIMVLADTPYDTNTPKEIDITDRCEVRYA